MSKRGIESKMEANCSAKVQIIENQDYKSHQHLLPIEILLQIFSNLSDIKDIHNCMMLSKEIRDAIFRTPQIMRKMLTKTDRNDWNSFLSFVNHKGKFLRNVRFAFRSLNEKYMKFILHQLPNLEELGHYHYFDELGLDREVVYKEVDDVAEPADVGHLKKLFLIPDRFDKLLKITKNIKKLEHLECGLDMRESLEDFTNFVVQQDNLKVLKFDFWGWEESQIFPSRDISSEVKFQLTFLKLKRCFRNNPNFLTFLKTQAGSLEDLRLYDTPNDEVIEVILKMCKKLKRLSLRYSDSALYSELYPYSRLESVKFLKDTEFSTSALTKAFERFPNLKSIKCRKFENISGTFENICNLELMVLDVDKFQDVKLPNLTKLLTARLKFSSNEDNLIKFIENVENIDFFKIGDLELGSEQQQIFRHLPRFRHLQHFLAIFFETFETLYIPDGSEGEYITYDEDPIEHRISIDFNKKTIKCLDDSFDNELLTDTFHDFEFIRPQYRDFDLEF